MLPFERRTLSRTDAHTPIPTNASRQSEREKHAAGIVPDGAPLPAAYIRPFSIPFQYMRGRPYALSAYML